MVKAIAALIRRGRKERRERDGVGGEEVDEGWEVSVALGASGLPNFSPNPNSSHARAPPGFEPMAGVPRIIIFMLSICGRAK